MNFLSVVPEKRGIRLMNLIPFYHCFQTHSFMRMFVIDIVFRNLIIVFDSITGFRTRLFHIRPVLESVLYSQYILCNVP